MSGAHPIFEGRNPDVPAVSVVIPTFNRAETLGRTLDALDRQTRAPDEVVIVNDGSTDGSQALLEAWADRPHAFRARVERQENRGPAAARNRGIARSSGGMLVFLGDDTAPEPDLLAAHLRRHREAPVPSAVVGYTRWDEARVRVTPFLRYINEQGPQFKYAHMDPAGSNPFVCFYSSNLSLPRDVLGSRRFDEDFPLAGWEDTELGWRLAQAGVPILYEPNAVALHAHAVTLVTFAHRTGKLGGEARRLLARHPSLRVAARIPRPFPAALLRAATAPLLSLLPLFGALDRRGIRLPAPVYRALLGAVYLRGYRRQSSRPSR